MMFSNLFNSLSSMFVNWFMTTSDRNIFALFFLVDFILAVIITIIVMAAIEFVKTKVGHLLWVVARKREMKRHKASLIRMRNARRRRVAAYGYKGYDKNLAA